MIGTLVSMTVPLAVLLVLGTVVLGLAWWLAVQAEGRDEWLTGAEPVNHDAAIVEHLKRQSEFYAANPRVDAQPEWDDQ